VDHDFEKLGALYLGNEVDPASGERRGLLLLDARDLTTHGVIIGMTGSGKTGLGVGLIEEAAIDRIPVIAIDPKGDLGNLLLTFPDLAPADFRPGSTRTSRGSEGRGPRGVRGAAGRDLAQGPGGWDQDGERIRRLREHADFASTRRAARPASRCRCCARSTRRRRR
jgi:DNA helicase HerA-like ATPase